MKFGGDCLATPKNQLIVSEIIESFKGKKIVVCSAMGRDGFPYSTFNLNKVCDEQTISLKERDRLLSLGETISSIRMSSILNMQKIKSYSLSYLELGLICDECFGNGNVIDEDDSYLQNLLSKYDVLLIPGFIGQTRNKEVVTLGRGNSDLSAIHLAKMMNVKKAYLFKNVDGVYHTSPTVYKQLKAYDYLSYQQMLVLNKIGFEIVSRKALLAAEKFNIEIDVKSFLNLERGTIIGVKESNDVFLGFNIIDKLVKVATFNIELIKKKIKEELAKVHIFIKNEESEEDVYSFEINKSILPSVKKTLIKVMNEVNNFS